MNIIDDDFYKDIIIKNYGIRVSAILLLFISLIANAQQPVKFATLDFKPFIWCEGTVARGLYSDIIEELFLRVGREYEIECLPWKRALNEVQTGRVDGLFAAFKTIEREEFAYYSALPMRIGQYVVFTDRSKTFTFRQLSDLFGKTVAITRGHSVSDDFDHAKELGLIKVIEVKSASTGFKVLLAGRADAYINDKIVGLFEANEQGLSSKISVLDIPIQEANPAYLLFSKASDLQDKQQIITQVNEKLESMWRDGTLENIYSDYIELIYLAENVVINRLE